MTEGGQHVKDPRRVFSLQGIQCGAPYTFKVFSAPTEASKAKDIMEDCFADCDDHLDNENPESEVSIFNDMEKGEPHQMSNHLEKLLKAAMKSFANASSRSLFDPNVAGALPSLPGLGDIVQSTQQPKEATKKVSVKDALKEDNWKDDDMDIRKPEEDDKEEDASIKEGSTASTNEIKEEGAGEAKPSQSQQSVEASIRSLAIDYKQSTVTKRRTETFLDLTELSKVYIVDLVIEQLRSRGYDGAFFEWGSASKALGYNHKGEAWKVGVIHIQKVSPAPAKGGGRGGGAGGAENKQKVKFRDGTKGKGQGGHGQPGKSGQGQGTQTVSKDKNRFGKGGKDFTLL